MCHKVVAFAVKHSYKRALKIYIFDIVATFTSFRDGSLFTLTVIHRSVLGKLQESISGWGANVPSCKALFE